MPPKILTVTLPTNVKVPLRLAYQIKQTWKPQRSDTGRIEIVADGLVVVKRLVPLCGLSGMSIEECDREVSAAGIPGGSRVWVEEEGEWVQVVVNLEIYRRTKRGREEEARKRAQGEGEEVEEKL